MKRLLLGFVKVVEAALVAWTVVVTFAVAFVVLLLFGFEPFGLPAVVTALVGAAAMASLNVWWVLRGPGDAEDSILDTDFSEDSGFFGTYFDD